MIRINFNLPTEIQSEFEKIANKKGITKSELLRIWINDFEINKYINFHNKEQRAFNLFIEKNSSKFLNNFSKEFSISKSEIIRNIIQTKIEETNFVMAYQEIPKINLSSFYQHAVDYVCQEFDLLGAGLGLVDEGKIFSKAHSSKWYTKKLFQFIPGGQERNFVQIGVHTHNINVKAVVEKKYFITHDMYDIAGGPFSPLISSAISKFIGFKSGLMMPLIYKNTAFGTFLVMKNYKDNFKVELPLLLKYTKNLSSEIVCRVEINLQKQRT